MPSTRLSDIEERPCYEASAGSEVTSSAPCHGGSTRELETEYYLGGYDIDSDYPPPREEEFLSHDQLPPPLPIDEDFPEPYTPLVSMGCTTNSGSAGGQHARPQFHPSQYLPSHQLLSGEILLEDFSTSVNEVGNMDTDDSVLLNMQLSAGAQSTSDLQATCVLDDSEHGSDFESVDEVHLGVTIVTDSQQQTEV